MEVFILHRTLKGILAAALVLCLCLGTAAAETFYQEIPAKGITSSMNVTVNIPGENPVVDGSNPLTGESWKGSYTPIGVNIDTHPKALPNWGVSSADIIYEMPIQADGSTRSFALFMSEIPAFAGPVRSGRVPMGSLREMWGGAWVFYGWQTWFRDRNTVVDVADWAQHIHEDARVKGRWVFPFVEGTERNYANLFHRERDGQHVAPYNVQVDMKAVQALYAGQESVKRPFKFTETGLDRGIAVPHGRDKNVVSIAGAVALVDYSGSDGGMLSDYETIDKSQVKIIVLTLANDQYKTPYLQLMSYISRALSAHNGY